MKQYDFARNWRKKIKPLLNYPAVQIALHLGMGLQGVGYTPGDPPWLYGRGPLNGQRARKGSLSWYQPWGRCHHIAPFTWAIGKEFYSDLQWGFVTGDAHTVAVGFQDEWVQPELVMDILNFRRMTAEESLAFALTPNPSFHASLHTYAASFCKYPDFALEVLRQYPILDHSQRGQTGTAHQRADDVGVWANGRSRRRP
jgi:hypothetical protein